MINKFFNNEKLKVAVCSDFRGEELAECKRDFFINLIEKYIESNFKPENTIIVCNLLDIYNSLFACISSKLGLEVHLYLPNNFKCSNASFYEKVCFRLLGNVVEDDLLDRLYSSDEELRNRLIKIHRLKFLDGKLNIIKRVNVETSNIYELNSRMIKDCDRSLIFWSGIKQTSIEKSVAWDFIQKNKNTNKNIVILKKNIDF